MYPANEVVPEQVSILPESQSLTPLDRSDVIKVPVSS